jgi:hypothetical protein
MGLPRSLYVKEGQEGVYHCFSRCVRRAFLCGYDPLTGRDFSHRKKWVVDRLRYLSSIFAIEVCAYAVMENHPHSILRTRPDIAVLWSDREVATRWTELCPKKRRLKGKTIPSLEEQIQALVDCPGRITILRKRLCSLSWFMAQLNEFIARASNKEDKVKGRFWEGRFKCQTLLDEAAIATCMVYVDLNPIRAGVATTPEGSEFTSIQERIRAWQKEKKTTDSISKEISQNIQTYSAGDDTQQWKESKDIPDKKERLSIISNAPNQPATSECWLCSIQSNANRRGILQMSETEYFDLVDKTGRMTRMDKRGAISADLAPILQRIGAIPEAWIETVSRFGSGFILAAGRHSNLRNFADQIGRNWVKGMMMSRSAFTSSLP